MTIPKPLKDLRPHRRRFFSVPFPRLIARLFLIALILPLTYVVGSGQTLPGEIRGYKVHRARIKVEGSVLAAGSKVSDAVIKVGEPRLVGASLTGITFDVPIEASPTAIVSGSIDFLAFNDFRVNDIPVEIQEYAGPIVFAKGDLILLSRPVRIFVGSGGILEAAWNEFRASKKDWIITGRVLAFGRFRKMGMKFKRVVPIDIAVSIKNPLAISK